MNQTPLQQRGGRQLLVNLGVVMSLAATMLRIVRLWCSFHLLSVVQLSSASRVFHIMTAATTMDIILTLDAAIQTHWAVVVVVVVVVVDSKEDRRLLL